MRSLLVVCVLMALVAPAQAATYYKADNTDGLNLTSSWTTGVVPGSTDIAEWDSIVTAARSTLIGDDLNWQGIAISNPGGNVTIAATATKTLTLGASGIDMTAAAKDLSISAALGLSAPQTWDVKTGRTLTVSGTVANGGNLLAVQGGGTLNMKSGIFSGDGGLIVTGGATVDVGSTNHTFTGQLTVADGIYVTSNNTVPYVGLGMGASPVILGGSGTTGTLKIIRTNTANPTTKNFTLATGGTGHFEVTAHDYTLTISGAIDGSGNLIKSGAGHVILSAANTYTGGTSVNAGTLTATQAAALPGYNVAGKVVFNGGTLAVQVGGSNWTTGDVDTLLSNAAKTAGAIGIDTSKGNLTQWTAFTNANLGSLVLAKMGNNTLTLDRANSHSGGTTLSGGSLNINDAQALGTGTFTIANGTTINNSSGDAITNSNNNVMVWGGGFTFTGPNNLDLGTGAVTLVGQDRNLTVNGSTLTIGGVMSGGRNLTKNGPGTLVLAAANTISGEININAGILVATNVANGGEASSIGTNSGGCNLCIYPGTTFKYIGSGHSTNRIFNLRGTGTGPRTIDASGTGAIQFTGTGNIGHLDSGQRLLVLAGTNTDDNTMRPNLTNKSATDILSLTKSGVGKWILTGTNTYTGDTTIAEGTLTLGSTGSLLMDINSTGGFTELLGSGTLNLDGTLKFDVAGVTDFGSWKLVADTLNVTYGPTFSVEMYGGPSFVQRSDVWSHTDAGGIVWTFSESTGILGSAPIPEPGTLTLIGMALLGLGWYAWRKRRR